mmetsp:Transcript_45947/g.133124  ORF Transcript_45947/g.133124 Transcript_45947/m.133124 type:complete len:206 (+) Transcript_45947:38-655(+)
MRGPPSRRSHGRPPQGAGIEGARHHSALPGAPASAGFSSPVMSPSSSMGVASPASPAGGPPSPPAASRPCSWPPSRPPRMAAERASSSSASFALLSEPGPLLSAAALASSSASSSLGASFRFFAGLSAVGQPALAQPTRSAGRGESHQMGPPMRLASKEAQEMHPVETEGPTEPGFLRCSGTLQMAVVPKFVFRLSMAASEQRYS